MSSKPKLKLYNTATRKIETFASLNPDIVKIYTCGPTVYSQPHIGNYAAYVYWDLLIRTLEALGYQVRRVLNLTDVGHLVSDSDEGEDKLEKGARLSGKTVWEVAEFYIDAFKNDFHALGLREPAVWARATDYIPNQIELVNLLTAGGYTYETRDGIYYDTSKFPDYAKFAHLDLANLQAGARVEFSDEKRHASDFAVWKFIQPNEKHAMRWDYLGRPGYPGWHLECSAIIHAELGETIDIHTGGIDHIPIHHTNEIAQSNAAFGKELAKTWLHCNFLTVNGEKISKSLGNTYTLQDLAEAGYSPYDFKMWVLQGHYQSERDFTIANLESARQRRLNWRNHIARAYQQLAPIPFEDDYDAVLEAVSENLNSPQAFALIDSIASDNLAFWKAIDELFGLNLLADSPALPPAAAQLLSDRAAARAAKDYQTSDRLREQLATYNLTVLDTPAGQTWQYLR